MKTLYRSVMAMVLSSICASVAVPPINAQDPCGSAMGNYTSLAQPTGTGVGKLTGCFLQFDANFHNRDDKFWTQVVSDTNDAGLSLLIIQYTKMLHPDPSKTDDFTSDCDALLNAVAKFNQANPTAKAKTTVMIGLANCDKELWSGSVVGDEVKTTKLISRLNGENTPIISHIKSLYAGKEYFAGFYIPLELWPFCKFDQPGFAKPVTDTTLGNIRNFLQSTTDSCKHEVTNASVTASVYFNPWQFMDWVGPDKTFIMYKDTIFRDTKLDAVMVQDGIGTRIIEASNVGGKLQTCHARAVDLTTQYFSAFYDACNANGIPVWADIEVFTAGPQDPARTSSDPWIDWSSVQSAPRARVQSQLDFVQSRKSQVQKGVAFEYLHYLNAQDPKCADLYNFVKGVPNSAMIMRSSSTEKIAVFATKDISTTEDVPIDSIEERRVKASDAPPDSIFALTLVAGRRLRRSEKRRDGIARRFGTSSCEAAAKVCASHAFAR